MKLTHCALFVAEPNSSALNVNGVVMLAEKVPAAAGLEDEIDVAAGKANKDPGNAEPSTIVPLAFSITLQSVIEPMGVDVGVVDVAVPPVELALALAELDADAEDEDESLELVDVAVEEAVLDVLPPVALADELAEPLALAELVVVLAFELAFDEEDESA